MDDDAPFDYLLDQPAGPAPGPEDLRAIVARSGRIRARITAGLVAAALAAGGAAGWVSARGGSSGGTNLAAGSGPSTTTPASPRYAAVAGGNTASGLVGGPIANSLNKSFVRTTPDAVTIRAYKVSPPAEQRLPGGAMCGLVYPELQAEVSTAAVVGQVWSGFQTQSGTGAIEAISSMTLGVAEGAPVWVVITKTAATVAQVRVTFADGKTDQMTPVDGWAVLAHGATAGASQPPAGTAEAFDGSGKSVGSKPVTDPGMPPGIPVPAPAPAPAVAPAVPATGSAVAGGAPPVGQIVPVPGTAGTLSPDQRKPVACMATVPPAVVMTPGQILPAAPTPKVSTSTTVK